MHNGKNIVLMFLIVMLSFAIISEVSAAAIDEAEHDESGLNEPDGLFKYHARNIERKLLSNI